MCIRDRTEPAHTDPAKPWQSGTNESFNGKSRDECLGVEWSRPRREAQAKGVCESCSANPSCRQYARTNHEYGLWGGESEDERHAAGFRLIAPIGVRARNAG